VEAVETQDDNSVVNDVVEVLSDGSTVVEEFTTPGDEEYYVQIQGSDRKYPAIVIRRKHRGVGATILTISKNGQHSELYADYESAIAAYVVKRRYNTPDNRESPTTRPSSESSVVILPQDWFGETIQGVVTGRGNSPETPL
jgi:hypothetical protein